jgi:hypothetical protein
MFNDHLHFRPDRGISGVMQLNQHRHFPSILQRHFSGRGATRLVWRCRSSHIATPERRNAGKMFMKNLGFFAV